jgi:hypothetical protein
MNCRVGDWSRAGVSWLISLSGWPAAGLQQLNGCGAREDTLSLFDHLPGGQNFAHNLSVKCLGKDRHGSRLISFNEWQDYGALNPL